MEYIKENLDSVAFGKSILKIENIDISVNFNDFEDRYIKEYSPLYVYARIPIEDLQKIHYLENCGFNYVETQFKMKKRLLVALLGAAMTVSMMGSVSVMAAET